MKVSLAITKVLNHGKPGFSPTPLAPQREGYQCGPRGGGVFPHHRGECTPRGQRSTYEVSGPPVDCQGCPTSVGHFLFQLKAPREPLWIRECLDRRSRGTLPIVHHLAGTTKVTYTARLLEPVQLHGTCFLSSLFVQLPLVFFICLSTLTLTCWRIPSN